jgi:hypothetical protein
MNRREIIPPAGLLAVVAAAAYMVVQVNAQTAVPAGDFTNAATAEVRDSQGQVLLRGPFVAADEDDDDVERKATLQSTGVDGDAAGEAEVEFARSAPAVQEIEFGVRNLPPDAALTFVVDGTTIGTATTDRRGRAELEVDIPMPGATAPR